MAWAEPDRYAVTALLAGRIGHVFKLNSVTTTDNFLAFPYPFIQGERNCSV